MADKFLIIDTSFRMSRSVQFHNELLPNNRKRDEYKVLGGGRFYIDDDNKRVLIYGTSDEFKSAKKEDILTALKDTMLSPSLFGYKFYISAEEWMGEALKDCNARDKEDWIYEE